MMRPGDSHPSTMDAGHISATDGVGVRGPFGGYGGWRYARWIRRRPYYAPALVAFFGGSHFGVSIGIGGGGDSLGWVPLGYGEVYTPPYAVSQELLQTGKRLEHENHERYEYHQRL